MINCPIYREVRPVVARSFSEALDKYSKTYHCCALDCIKECDRAKTLDRMLWRSDEIEVVE